MLMPPGDIANRRARDTAGLMAAIQSPAIACSLHWRIAGLSRRPRLRRGRRLLLEKNQHAQFPS